MFQFFFIAFFSITLLFDTLKLYFILSQRKRKVLKRIYGWTFARLYSHDESHVDVVYERQNGVHGRVWLDAEAHFHAGLFDLANAFLGRAGGLQVKRELRGARVTHVLDPFLWILDHHVHVEEGLLDVCAQTLHYRVAERQIVHKMSVHHIQMLIGGVNIIGKTF